MTFVYGIMSRNVLCVTAAAEQLKKAELMRLRHDARHERKAHAMASRTKDNLQVYTEETEGKAPEAKEEPVVDLKHLFTKHDRRVPHLPSEAIPDMLAKMKERQKQRHLAREEAKRAAAAAAEASDVKVMQQKLNTETAESDFKHKKVFASSRAAPDEKFPVEKLSSHSRVVQSKSVSADKNVECKGKVKKSHLPPMSFEQLMALAEQKHAEPVVDTQPTNTPTKVSVQQDQRPMTQEEKERQQRRATKEYQHWLQHGGRLPPAPSGRKSRHQQSARKSHKDQRVTVDSDSSRNDASDESDVETDEIYDVPSQEVNAKKSYLPTTANRLKVGTDITRQHSPAMKTEKNFSSQSNSSQRSLEHSSTVSRGEVMFTKGNVTTKGNEAGQNGKSKSFSDELIEKLKEERRKMADRGDAVPSLADMLQDLLSKVCSDTNSQKSTTKHLVPSGSTGRSVVPSSSCTKSKSKVSVCERKVEPSKSAASRSQLAVASTARHSSQYVTVNETVVDCTRDKPSSTKPVKPSDKRPTKSTWEEMYERARSKNPHHDKGLLKFYILSLFSLCCLFCNTFGENYTVAF